MGRCLHALFEAQARARPGSIAVVDGEQGRSVDYAELNRAANRLAHHLAGLEVEVETFVGVCLGSRIERVVTLLGILKAGAAYLPLDPTYPDERLQLMLRDARVPLVVTVEALAARIPDGIRCVEVDAQAERIAARPSSVPAVEVSPDNLAYVIYTSGSTGRPKGIGVRHCGIANNLLDLSHRFRIGPGDRVAALSSLSFDMAVFEILGSLSAGATVVLPGDAAATDPGWWVRLAHEQHVTIWNSAPALLQLYVEALERRPDLRPGKLRLALLGGDWIPVSLPGRLRALVPDVEVVSLGGATEASIHSTVYRIAEVDPGWTSIPYGHALDGQSVYVLDDDLEPVPDGAAGELFIGGAGLARGYLGRPRLTARKFVPDPHSPEPGARMYRTGDRVRRLPDGELELLGRIDLQVKVRGHRVDVREVEAVLERHPRVAEAVVVGRDDGTGTRTLAAYVVPAERSSRGRRDRDGDHERHCVQGWHAVYEEMYRSNVDHEAERDFAGWVSSATGERFPAEELSEVIDATVERVRSLGPESVLEVGCGTGLMLFELAPACARYDACDISSAAVDAVRRRLQAKATDSSHVRVERRAADDFSGVEPGAYDIVIINSVAQHFPGVRYLLRCLEGALGALREGGAVFLGDVRCLPLLEAFHLWVELRKSSSSLPLELLHQRVRRGIDREKELWLDPALFAPLSDRLPGVTAADVMLRKARHRNEMSLFHVDVVLRTGAGVDAPEVRSRAWNEVESANVRDLIEGVDTDGVAVRDVPDPRVQPLIRARELLEASKDGSVADLQARLEEFDVPAGLSPEDLWKLGDELSRDVTLLWPESGRPGHYDVVIRRRDSGSAPRPRLGDAVGGGSPPVRDHRLRVLGDATYTNTPALQVARSRLVADLRRTLAGCLPDFMVPSHFMILEELPLSPNGKVDRSALPVPQRSRSILETEYAAPRDVVEDMVAAIWADVMELDRVGRDDEFFDLGGHSLTATQIVGRTADLLQLEVPLATVFEHPTVAGFSARLHELADAQGIDVTEVALLLEEVATLPEEEVWRALEAGGRYDTTGADGP